MKVLRCFPKRKGLKTRDIAIDPVSATLGGSAVGLSLFHWLLIAIVAAGVVFAIVKIVKISKKKRMAQV